MPSSGVDLQPLGQARPAVNNKAPMNPNMTAVREQSSTPFPSPLLRLPFEIRMMIWKWVIGNQTVHIWRQNRDKPLRHHICSSTMTESEAYQLSTSQEYENNASKREYTEDMRDWGFRHKSCCDLSHAVTIPDSCKMDLRVLTLCRQIYPEINETLWRTTTWSTSDRDFDVWMKSTNMIQWQNLRHVQIRADCFMWFWLPVLEERGVKTLESLHIEMSQEPFVYHLLTRSRIPFIEAVEVIYTPSEKGISWEQRVSSAKNIRNQLMTLMKF